MKKLRLMGGVVVLFGVGCAETDATSPSSRDQPLPQAYADPDGKRWVAMRRVKYEDVPLEQEASARPEGSESGDDLDLATLSIEDLAPLVAPKMEHDGIEYELDQASLFALAARIQASERAQSTRIQADLGPHGAEHDKPHNGASPFEDTNEKRRFGAEDRQMSANPSTWAPARMIASMNAGECTAFKFINHHTAATAAHCVHSGSGWKPRKTITFGASASWGSVFNQLPATCYDRTVPGSWDGQANHHEFDYAVLRLHSNTAGCNFNDYNTGVFGYRTVDNGVSGIYGVVAGYPFVPDENNQHPTGAWSPPEQWFHQNTSGYTNCCGIYNGHLWHKNDATDGQSGAPYWTIHNGSHEVRGIHYGFNQVGNDTNGAVRMKSSVIDWFQANAGY